MKLRAKKNVIASKKNKEEISQVLLRHTLNMGLMKTASKGSAAEKSMHVSPAPGLHVLISFSSSLHVVKFYIFCARSAK